MMLNKSYLKGVIGSGLIAGLAVAGATVFVVISRQPEANESPCGPLTPVKLVTPTGTVRLLVPADQDHSGSQPQEAVRLHLTFPNALPTASAAAEERQVALTLFTDALSDQEDADYKLRDPRAFWTNLARNPHASPQEQIDSYLGYVTPGHEMHVTTAFKESIDWKIGSGEARQNCPGDDGGGDLQQCSFEPYDLYYLIKPKSAWIIHDILMLAQGSTRSEFGEGTPNILPGRNWRVETGPFTPVYTGTFEKAGSPIHFYARVENALDSSDEKVETTEIERQRFLDSLDYFVSECVSPVNSKQALK